MLVKNSNSSATRIARRVFTKKKIPCAKVKPSDERTPLRIDIQLYGKDFGDKLEVTEVKGSFPDQKDEDPPWIMMGKCVQFLGK